MLNIEVNDANANAVFIEKLADETALQDVRTMARTFIRKELKEKELTRQVIPPEFPTASELDKLPNKDELVKIIEIEPDATGAIISFEGKGDYKKLENEDGVIEFFAVESERTETTTSKLKSRRMPIVKLIEDDQINAIGNETDIKFFKGAAQAAIDAGQAIAWDDSSADWMVTKDFTAFINTMEGGKLEMDLVVMSKPTFNNLANLDASALGMDGNRQLVHGYKYETLLKKKILVTTKTDIIPDGLMLGFTAPEFLGNYLITEETKFFIKHNGRDIAWWAWEEKGVGILNNKGVSLIVPDSSTEFHGVDLTSLAA